MNFPKWQMIIIWLLIKQKMKTGWNLPLASGWRKMFVRDSAASFALWNAKGHLISKANCQIVNSSKNQRNICFWKKLETPKRHLEIIWPLTQSNLKAAISSDKDTLGVKLNNLSKPSHTKDGNMDATSQIKILKLSTP